MPGGLLNIVAYGASNIILNGNPSKTFFKAAYKKYTNFGLQRFRLDHTGQRILSFDSETLMEFKIPRYADLLWDTYVVVTMPNIWSPLFPRTDISGGYVPYEFRWTRKLGTTMIREITISSGGSLLARYSGEWMSCVVERDEGPKRRLWNRMVGNVPEMYDPANANDRGGAYPNAMFFEGGGTTLGSDRVGIEPSIRGRQLFIPLEAWFSNSSKLALPLVALQYQEVTIRVRFRPVRDLFTILDVANVQDVSYNDCSCNPQPPQDWNINKYNLCGQTSGSGQGNTCGFWDRRAPNPADVNHQLWWFLQPPPAQKLYPSSYLNRRQDWFADIHLLATYVFLGQDERRVFAARDHKYLVKTQYHYDFLNATGSKRVRMTSRDMVDSYMFRFRRSDAFMRNEWNNYTNWPYKGIPPNELVIPTGLQGTTGLSSDSYFRVSPPMDATNVKEILVDLGILLGSEYRENILPVGVYNLVEKWIRTTGEAEDGLYIYNFCINSNRRQYQPSGAQNMNKWEYVWFEYNTLEPPLDPSNNDVQILCDASGAVIGVRKDLWRLNKYNYDLRVFESRYNVVVITSGCIGLADAR